MEKEFVPYPLALRLKALGFDEPCFGYYDGNHNFQYMFQGKPQNFSYKKFPLGHSVGWTSAPTYSQAFRWFREKYNLICRVDVTSYGCPLNEQEFYCEITSKNGTASYEIFNTYEEAELDCLEKLIELVEQK